MKRQKYSLFWNFYFLYTWSRDYNKTDRLLFTYRPQVIDKESNVIKFGKKESKGKKEFEYNNNKNNNNNSIF